MTHRPLQRSLRVPDLGDVQGVAVIDVLVKPGDRVEVETPLVTLESDKATMDVPSTAAGVVDARAGRRRATRCRAAPRSRRWRVRGAVDATRRRRTAALRATEPYGGEPYLDTVPIKPMAPTSRRDPAPAQPARRRDPARSPAAARRGDRHSYDFDLVVLGAGPGGYTAAFRAADLGLRVALIERGPTLGGVCLNVGCIPSKALLHAARVIEDARVDGRVRHPVRRARDRCRRSCATGRTASSHASPAGSTTLARQRKVTVIRGEATFVAAHELQVDEGGTTRTVSFDQCIIAAGSESLRLPGLPDDPRIIDSTGALELDLPERLLVIGGGIIGLEMATVYDALGVARQRRRADAGTDAGLRPRPGAAAREAHRRALRAHPDRHAGGGRRGDGRGAARRFEGERAPEPQLYDKVLVAVGRSPNGSRIGAEAAGVHVDERGFIPVDRQMRTNVPHIFAIGDVVGQPMLAHKATHEGKVAAEAAAGLKSFFDARVIPSVAYTDPEVAWVGLTETDAKARGVAVREGRRSRGRPAAARSRSAATRASRSCCSTRRRTACSAAASSAPTRAT